jgi:excisionase family DNA binding protein
MTGFRAKRSGPKSGQGKLANLDALPYKWISEKHMPAHKVGRLWKFKKEEIDEWVKSGSAGKTADH